MMIACSRAQKFVAGLIAAEVDEAGSDEVTMTVSDIVTAAEDATLADRVVGALYAALSAQGLSRACRAASQRNDARQVGKLTHPVVDAALRFNFLLSACDPCTHVLALLERAVS